MTPPDAHIPVLLEQTLDALAPDEGQIYADATAGLGGHALAVAGRLGPNGRVILGDVDPGNLSRAEASIRSALGAACPDVRAWKTNFADLPRRLVEADLAADMVLADLGFSSNQMSDPARGLSFMVDAPLDMRLDPELPTTAADLVATLPVEDLTRVLGDYGEERHAGRIARKLAEARREGPILTTHQLAQIVRAALPSGGGRAGGGGAGIDPATRTFQALRIAVNDELGVLESLLESIGRAARAVGGGGRSWLRAGARVAIISFHSLEDRLVKRAFADLVRQGLATDASRGLRRAEDEELDANRRARSARLRAVRLGPISTPDQQSRSLAHNPRHQRHAGPDQRDETHPT